MNDNVPDQLHKAAQLLHPDSIGWLPSYFGETLQIARNFYACGVGRIKPAAAKKEIQKFAEEIARFETILTGWGAVFCQRDDGLPALTAVRTALPALKKAVARAEERTGTKSGPGAASMVDDWLYPKEIVALGVWLAAQQLGQKRRERALFQTAEMLWTSSDLAESCLRQPATFSIFEQIAPSRSSSWEHAFKRVKTVCPTRGETGQLEAYDMPLMCSAGTLASYFLLLIERKVRSG